MLKKINFLAILALALVLVSAVSNSGSVQAQANRVNTGNLRITNALPGIGAVDVYLDEQIIAYALKPEEVTTYFVIAAGRHALAVRVAAGDALAAPVADILIDLEPNGSQTAVIYQTQFADGTASVTVNQSSAVFIINDDRSPIQLGKTRITAVHLAMGTPERINIGYPSGEPILYQIGLRQPFGTIDVDTKPYNLAILNADAPSSTVPPVLERLGEINFYANTLYTFIVVPNAIPSGNPTQVGALSAQTKTFVLSAPLEPPIDNGLRLRIVHAAHSTAVVDVYIDERLVASRVNYGDFTEYLGLADYSHTITIRHFGDKPDDPNVKPLARGTLTRTAENSKQIDYTLLLVNSNAQNTSDVQSLTNSGSTPNVNTPVIFQTENGAVMMSLLPDDLSETQRGLARVRIINAAEGVQAISLFTSAYPIAPVKIVDGIVPTAAPTPTAVPVPGISLAANAAFGAEASTGEVPPGLYSQLNFIPSGASNSLTSISNIQLVAGVIYTFVVMGSPSGNPPVKAITLQDYGSGLALQRAFNGVLLGNANIREQPDSTSARLIQLPKDTEIEVLGRNMNGQWVRIRFINPNTGTRTEGWISTQANVIRITRAGTVILPSALPVYTGT